MAPGPAGRMLLLDACCVLNFFATGRIEEILRTLKWRSAITAVVSGEAMWIYRGGDGEDARERDPVDVEPLAAIGLLEVLTPETDAETDDFVAFAALLDDGEAMTAALAMHRGAAIATDDRKARREISSRAPHITLLSTAELLYAWSRDAAVAPAILRQALRNVTSRAHFVPARQDLLRAWWDSATQHK